MSQGTVSTTVFSLCAEQPGASAAALHDGAAGLDPAWLTGEAARHPCHVRKLSAAGATLAIDPVLEPGERFLLELTNGQAIPGHLAWIEDSEAGFVFDDAVDVVGTLARNLARLPAERRLVPRVELHQTVGVRHGAAFEFARTRDLSQGGVGIETSLDLFPEAKVGVAFDGLHALTGTVRWTRGRAAGIAFDEPIAWQVLMPWLRHAQRAPQAHHHPIRTSALHGDESSFGLAKDKMAIRLDAAARVREGARWWNVQVERCTGHLVEFRADAPLAKGAQLWLELPGAGGWPASVIEAERGHYLAEFRVPLRQHDLDLLLPQPRIAMR